MPAPHGLAIRAILAAGVSLFIDPAPGADASGQGWSMVRMDLEVALDPASKRFELESRLRLRLDREDSLGPTLGVNVNAPVMRFIDVQAEGARTELNVSFPGSPNIRLAHVRYATPKLRGTEIEIVIHSASEGRSSQLIVDEAFALASWVDAWYPVPLPETLDSFSPNAVAAPGRTSFHLEEGWTAVSNGTRTRDDGAIVWDSPVPVARSFAAGRLEEAVYEGGDAEVRVFRLAPKPKDASEQARTLALAIRAMEKRFGRYPFGSYSIVEAPDELTSWYASSEQGFIIADSAAFEVEGGNLPLFAHEAAHGWWGNTVSGSGPGSILCSESLSQYGAVIAIEEIEGEEAAAHFLRFSRAGYSERQCAKGFFEIWRKGGDRPLAELSDGKWDHDLSDAKGHWMFHMLRRRVGDDLFFRTLRAVIEDPAKRRTTLAALRSSFAEAAPEARLERFFSDWLDRPGAPVLTEHWSDASDATGPRVRLVIEQRERPYDLDLEVEVEGATGVVRHSIRLSEVRGEWVLDSRGEPRKVTLDPHHRTLMWKPEYGELPPPVGG
jgi:hypothetical protein